VIEVNTKGVESPNTLLLPTGAFSLLSTKRIANTITTVLKLFLSKARSIRNVDSWHYLDTAGVGGTRRALA
jgi:hypothetical protein